MRYIDRFEVLLLDMGGTFMFDGDHFSDSADFGATYRHLGGFRLSPGTVRLLLLDAFTALEEAYHDPAWYHSFPPLRLYLQNSPTAHALPDSELDLLEEVFALHEIGSIPESHVATLHNCTRRTGSASYRTSGLQALSFMMPSKKQVYAIFST